MSRRAESLADRIEEGADGLAGFAEGLSEAEWRIPVSGKTGARSASSCTMSPACTLLRSISREQSPAARPLRTSPGRLSLRLNAKNAHEQADVTKAAALELLRRNSREAAAAVRTFTDDELDRAAPFSLSLARLSPRSSSLRITHCGTAGTTWRALERPWAGEIDSCQTAKTIRTSLAFLWFLRLFHGHEDNPVRPRGHARTQ